jgi:hypothetical protein
MPLKDITKVHVHPSKKLTVVFPPHTRIIHAMPQPSSAMSTKKDFNSFDIGVDKDFIGGEITVRYTYNNDIRNIRVMKIKVNLYENIKSGENIYYPIVKYFQQNNVHFTFVELLEEYERLTGEYPTETVFFVYKGVGISLIEDNINGIYQIENKWFRIEKR